MFGTLEPRDDHVIERAAGKAHVVFCIYPTKSQDFELNQRFIQPQDWFATHEERDATHQELDATDHLTTFRLFNEKYTDDYFAEKAIEYLRKKGHLKS